MMTNRSAKATGKRLVTVAFALALAAGISGCATDKTTTGSVARASGKPLESMSSAELDSAARSLGSAYASNTNDKGTALQYATVLQMDGRSDQALAVMRKLAITHPKDRDVRQRCATGAYGAQQVDLDARRPAGVVVGAPRLAAGVGQLEPALDAVRRAQTPEYPDWKLLSAEGAILDQLGQAEEARQLYRKALDQKPNEPSVLSNLGMSYLLTGDLKTAETHMRTASQAPGADSRVRQNLALVVGLQGRFQEAEAIASQELSPEQAQANVAYLRGMLAQQNAWNQLKKEDQETNTN